MLHWELSLQIWEKCNFNFKPISHVFWLESISFPMVWKQTKDIKDMYACGVVLAATTKHHSPRSFYEFLSDASKMGILTVVAS